MEIFKEEKETTKYYLDQKEAAGIRPELMAVVNFYMRKYVERKFKRSGQYLRRYTANLLFY